MENVICSVNCVINCLPNMVVFKHLVLYIYGCVCHVVTHAPDKLTALKQHCDGKLIHSPMEHKCLLVLHPVAFQWYNSDR